MKKVQNYTNHVRYYVPHHFIFYPVILFLLIYSVRNIFQQPEQAAIWTVVSILVFVIGWLSFMLRQHYALNNQNRIVRLEMRLRYYQLTHNDFVTLEKKLSFSQIAALRFASDNELVSLVEKTISEQLSPGAIKRSITQWTPDHMRV